MRVLGGPAIGDIRNRLLSLARRRNTDVAAAVNLLSYRLGPDAREAKMEWQEIVEGRHALWYGVTEDYKHIIRAYLVHFEVQLLRRTSVFIRDASDEYGKMGDPFDFSHGSIGNFFFTGQLFKSPAPCSHRQLRHDVIFVCNTQFEYLYSWSRLRATQQALSHYPLLFCYTYRLLLSRGAHLLQVDAVRHPTVVFYCRRASIHPGTTRDQLQPALNHWRGAA